MHASWLVLHGDLFRWLALALFVVGGWVTPVYWRRLRVWREGNGLRQAFERAEGGPFEADTVVTLKGRLELRGAGCVRFEDGGGAAVATVRGPTRTGTVRGEHLYLRGEQTALLEGPLEVLAGSRQSARSQRLDKLDLATVQRVGVALAAELKEPLQFLSLAHGDPIWVQGRLLRCPSENDSVTGWRLLAETNKIPLLYRGVPRLSTRGWWLSIVATMAAIVLYFGLAKLAYVTGSYELAAATPYRRLALQRLRDRYALAAEHDAKALEPLAVVQGLRGDYCRLLSRLRELGYLDRAARVSQRCNEPAERDALALCLLRQGRFAGASAVLEPPGKGRGALYPGVDLAVNVHLLANQPRRALSRLEYLSQLEPVGGISAEVANETKTRTQCLSLALRARLDHDAAALAALRRRSEAPVAQYACTVLYADLVEGDEQLHAIQSCAACRTKRTLLALPWLLGVKAACPRGKEESTRCTDWLLEAQPTLRHAQWDYEQPIAWISHAIPGVEAEVSRYLVESPNRTQRMTDAWTWVRDRMGVFETAIRPSTTHDVQHLLEELATARDAGQILPKASRTLLGTVLYDAAAERSRLGGDTPPVRKIVFEQGTCYRPRGWYEREVDPRRTLASLLWTAQSVDAREHPELVGEIWITARAFATALNQRETAVVLMALHH